MINNIQNTQFLPQAQQYKYNSTNSIKPQGKKLNIYYYNDTHGNSDSMAGIVHSAKIFKQKNNLDKDTVSFVLSAGDNVSGSDKEKNSFIFNLMQNIMGVDVSAVGNHEMDGGAAGFSDIIKNKKINFVATNVEYEQDNPMQNQVKKSIIKEQNGEKIGFIGTMPSDFALRSQKEASKGIKVQDFENTILSLQKEIDNLKAQGINKIVLMSHSGYEVDVETAKRLDGVDVIIGGHSHSVVKDAKLEENVVMSKANEPVIITQAGENGKYYGILEAEFNDNGVITKVGNKVFDSPSTSKSPIIEAIKEKQLGKSEEIAIISQIDPMPENRRNAPCAYTDWVADSMRAQLKTDIAIVNAANTRKVPHAGTLTRRDVKESSPMNNSLIKTTLTQKQVVDAIKQASIETMNDEEGVPGLLHLSGARYKIDKQGNLLELFIQNKKGKEEKIDINNPSDKITYSAVFDNFVAKADGEYPHLAPLENVKVEEFNYDKDETMAKYLKNRKDKNNLVITDDKRIEIV